MAFTVRSIPALASTDSPAGGPDTSPRSRASTRSDRPGCRPGPGTRGLGGSRRPGLRGEDGPSVGLISSRHMMPRNACLVRSRGRAGHLRRRLRVGHLARRAPRLADVRRGLRGGPGPGRHDAAGGDRRVPGGHPDPGGRRHLLLRHRPTEWHTRPRDDDAGGAHRRPSDADAGAVLRAGRVDGRNGIAAGRSRHRARRHGHRAARRRGRRPDGDCHQLRHLRGLVRANQPVRRDHLSRREGGRHRREHLHPARGGDRGQRGAADRRPGALRERATGESQMGPPSRRPRCRTRWRLGTRRRAPAR